MAAHANLPKSRGEMGQGKGGLGWNIPIPGPEPTTRRIMSPVPTPIRSPHSERCSWVCGRRWKRDDAPGMVGKENGLGLIDVGSSPNKELVVDTGSIAVGAARDANAAALPSPTAMNMRDRIADGKLRSVALAVTAKMPWLWAMTIMPFLPCTLATGSKSVELLMGRETHHGGHHRLLALSKSTRSPRILLHENWDGPGITDVDTELGWLSTNLHRSRGDNGVGQRWIGTSPPLAPNQRPGE
ncbi:hypothetical protein OsJ_05863 [Oryza sativa Japonica Group]|uniref:Uncharacterized protein n=1 Tax=Oryza sativa subsp. japonica TaxID=39947 RepID=A3A4G1_ORYSJ|nr:hypothetical protein OsJ_05863 [Oryza sativa Japonica Group]